MLTEATDTIRGESGAETVPGNALRGRNGSSDTRSVPRQQTTVCTEALPLYLHDIRTGTLLTREEEQILSWRIVRAARVAETRTGPGEVVPVAADRARRDGDAARRRFVEANLRLVVAMARRFRNRGLSLLDIIQEGNLGLLAAVDGFDPARGTRFSTYAVPIIRNAMRRALTDRARTVRLPQHLVAAQRRVKRMRETLQQTLARDPSIEELAAALGAEWTPRKLAELMVSAHAPRSLDAPVGDDGTLSLGDTVADPAEHPQFEWTSARLLAEALEEALAGLSTQEATILRRRHGFADGRVHTLQAIGDDLKLTRQRVQQIEAAALRKLRDLDEATHKLRGFLDQESAVAEWVPASARPVAAACRSPSGNHAVPAAVSPAGSAPTG